MYAVDSGELFHCWSGMDVFTVKETTVQEAKRLITRVVNLHDRADTIPHKGAGEVIGFRCWAFCWVEDKPHPPPFPHPRSL